MGRDPCSAIHNGSRSGNQLDRRDLKRLAKGNGSQFHKPHIFLFVHDGSCLSRQVDARFFPQAKLIKILAVPVNAKALAHINKYRIAGIHGSLQKSLPSMSSYFVTADFAVLHHPEARAGKLIRQRYHSRLQSCRRGNDLKGRPRLVGIIDGRIPPHLVQPLLLFLYGKQCCILFRI